jgi:hypothetical protein
LAALTPFEPLGFVALAMAIGVPALWGAQRNQFVPFLIALVVFYSLLTNAGLQWWIIDAASHRPIHILIVLLGIAFVVAWLWRIGHLTEEMEDYQNTYQLLLARRSGSEAVEQRRVVATQVGRSRLQAWISDHWFDRIGGYYGGSQSGLRRLLGYGFSAIPIAITGLYFAVMILVIGLFFTQLSYLSGTGGGFGAMFFFIQFAVLMPGQMVGEVLAQRRPRLAFEMLLPMPRKQLIDTLLFTSVRNAIVIWCMIHVAIAIVLATGAQPFFIQTVVVYLVLSAATTLVGTGVALRTAVWPSRAKRFIAIFIGWFGLALPLFAWWFLYEKIGHWPFVLLALMLTAIGAGMLISARRAWLRLEIG